MSYTINGKTVPPIAVGTWSWGSGQNGSGIVFGSKADPAALNESFNIAFKKSYLRKLNEKLNLRRYRKI